MSVEAGIGKISQACRAMNLNRTSYYKAPNPSARSRTLRTQIIELSEDQPRYGYRRVTALIRRSGEEVNPKRVQRVRRQEGLQVRKRQRRTRRLGKGALERRRASTINEVWSWDFVHDMTEQGSRFRVLSLIDEYTRRCLVLRAGWSMRAQDVIDILEVAIATFGSPKHIRSDNGPEFIAYAIRDWLSEQRIGPLYIKPGSPWEQAYIESFHDKLRDECTNRELFGSLEEAQVILEEWRKAYNESRPHSSLEYQTPEEFATLCNPRLRSDSVLPPLGVAKQERDTKQTTNAELHF